MKHSAVGKIAEYVYVMARWYVELPLGFKLVKQVGLFM
jgi:hypothetical protein